MRPAREEARKYRSLVLCPLFREVVVDERAVKKRTEAHDDFVKKAVLLLSEMEGGCRELRLDLERAQPDAVLECGDKIYVVEVKSYPFATVDEERYCSSGYLRPYPADFEQAVSYKERARARTSKRIVPVLVYRGIPLGGLRDAPFLIFISEEEEEYLAGEHIVRSHVASGGRMRGVEHGVYKPGSECCACELRDCPVGRKMRSYLGCAGGRSGGGGVLQLPTDVISAYQRLLVTEWCLARHGTRCVKCGPIYLALSQTTLHRDDLPLTREHVLRAVGQQLLQQLESNRLLVEKSCDVYRESLNKIRIRNGYVVAEGVTRRDFLVMLEYISLLYSLGYGASGGVQSLPVPDKCYRTYHGEVARLVRNTSALPDDGRVFEAYYLPAIVDYLGERNIDVASAVASSFGALLGGDVLKKLSGSLRSEGGQAVSKVSRFQNEALMEIGKRLSAWLTGSEKKPPFVLMTAPPGSGKTLVFLVAALAVVLAGGKVVIMYPSKKLALQQVQQIYYTLEELNSQPGSRISLAILDGDSTRCSRRRQGPVRSLKCRQGRHSLEFQNGQYLCDGQSVNWFTDCEDGALSRDIIVTNPYKLSSMLMRRRSTARTLAERLRLIIIDEAHTILEPRELDFLTALIHRLFILGGIDRVEKYPAFILSSATITSSGLPFAEEARERLITFRSIGALERVESASPAEVNAFTKQISELLLGGNLANYYETAVIDYYSIGRQSSGKSKVTAPMVIFTNPMESPSGTVQEASVSLMLAAATRLYSGGQYNNFSSVVFFDSKETLAEVASYVRARLVSIEGSPADKTLTKPFFLNCTPGSLCIKGGWNGLKVIKNILMSGSYGELEDFSHLSLFCTRLSELNAAYKYASMMYSGQRAASAQPPKCYDTARQAAKQILRDLIQNVSNLSQRSTLLVHHADLEDSIRYAVERKLEMPGSWYTVLSTSTLELGVNLSGVGAVGQFGLPWLAENVIQRFGRGGRDESVLYSTVGFLFAKNTGEDVALIDEDYAVARLFAFKRTVLPPRNIDRLMSIEELIAYTVFRATGGNNQQVLHAVQNSINYLGIPNNTAPEIFNRINIIFPVMVQIASQQISSQRSTSLNNYKSQISFMLGTLCSQLGNYGGVQLQQMLVNVCKQYKDHPLKFAWEIYYTITQVINNDQAWMQAGSMQRTLLKLQDKILGMILQYYPSSSTRRDIGRLLQLSLIPPMPDPRIIDVTLNKYSISARYRQGYKVSNSSLREAYARSIPLKVDRYEEL